MHFQWLQFIFEGNFVVYKLNWLSHSICCLYTCCPNVMQAVNKHEWIVIIDLKNAYVRIPIIVEHRQFLHFHISIV